jgi:hypothetical protein
MVRYYLQATLVDDIETYNIEDSPVELQDNDNGGLWYPKSKVFFIKSLNREISVNWHPTEEYNYYYCDFEFGDKAMKEYVDKLLEPLDKITPIYNGKKMKVYILSKELEL